MEVADEKCHTDNESIWSINDGRGKDTPSNKHLTEAIWLHINSYNFLLPITRRTLP